MGCWSADMLGGDSQLDTLGFLEDMVGMKIYPVPTTPKAMQKMRGLLENLPELRFAELKISNENALPVVAAVFMAVGATMPLSVSQAADETARNELNTLDEAGWFDDGVERKAVLENFLSNLATYKPGTSVPVEHTGLFQTMAGKGAAPTP